MLLLDFLNKRIFSRAGLLSDSPTSSAVSFFLCFAQSPVKIKRESEKDSLVASILKKVLVRD